MVVERIAGSLGWVRLLGGQEQQYNLTLIARRILLTPTDNEVCRLWQSAQTEHTVVQSLEMSSLLVDLWLHSQKKA